MSESGDSNSPQDGTSKAASDTDADVRRLLELSGRRPEPPAAIRERVHSAVLDEWQAIDAKPRTGSRRRWIVPVSLAATVLVAFAAVLRTVVGVDVSPGVVAEITYASGGYSVRGAQSGEITQGAMVQSSSEGRLTVVMAKPSTATNATTVRLDVGTSVTFHAPDEVWLHRGRVFVDASGAGRLTVATDYGTITDIGTQFEVSANGEELQVAVREGRVDVSTPERTETAQAADGMGDLLRFADGSVERLQVPTIDERWDWIHGASAGLGKSECTVDEYLRWVTRENGLELDYASRGAQMNARQVDWPFCDHPADTDQLDELLETTKFLRIEPNKPYEVRIAYSR